MAHKISVVDSLVTRALRICSNDEGDLKKELSFIMKSLQNNGYPRTFIEKRILIQKRKQVIKEIEAAQSDSEKETNEEEFEKRVCLPYYPKVTEIMASFVRRFSGLEIAYSPKNKLSTYFNSHKDKNFTRHRYLPMVL